jgi:hypothetical protein
MEENCIGSQSPQRTVVIEKKKEEEEEEEEEGKELNIRGVKTRLIMLQ